jgi:hypothetical protein
VQGRKILRSIQVTRVIHAYVDNLGDDNALFFEPEKH